MKPEDKIDELTPQDMEELFNTKAGVYLWNLIEPLRDRISELKEEAQFIKERIEQFML